MKDAVFGTRAYLRAVVDAIPAPLFLLDRDTIVRDANTAGRELASRGTGVEGMRLCGDVLACVNAERSTEGCGTTEVCPNCIIRNAVVRACEGSAVFRTRAEVEIPDGAGTRTVCYLVTAVPFKHEGGSLALMTVEDITELMELRRLLPICSHCKKIRNDEQLWEQVEAYLEKRSNLSFTHGICPDCLRKYYPEADESA